LAKANEQSLLYAGHTWGIHAEYGYGDDWKISVSHSEIAEIATLTSLATKDLQRRKRWIPSQSIPNKQIVVIIVTK
jgi:hypothetical protein